jgi:hypothetical protein
MKNLILLAFALLLALPGYSQNKIFNKLTVTDQFKYTAGTLNANYVLASDAAGNATWQPAGATESLVVNDTATAAQTDTIPNTANYILGNGTTLATYTLVLPTAPLDGQPLYIGASASTIITLLTLSVTGSQTIDNALTTITQGNGAKYIYHAASTTWYKVL